MFGILVSAFNTLLGFLFRQAVLKFIVFTILLLVVRELFSALSSLLPKSTNIQDLFNELPSSVWYFLDLFQAPTGITLCISAYVTKFIIRRLPVVG